MPAILQKPPRKAKKGYDPDFRFTVEQYQKMVAEGIIEPGGRLIAQRKGGQQDVA